MSEYEYTVIHRILIYSVIALMLTLIVFMGAVSYNFITDTNNCPIYTPK